jgi:hypothetical protein
MRSSSLSLNSTQQNRNGLSFAELCAPVFYFNPFGVQVLRYRDLSVALDKAGRLFRGTTKEEAGSVSSSEGKKGGGACAPLAVRLEESVRATKAGRRARTSPTNVTGIGSSSGVADSSAASLCGDMREMKARAFPHVARFLYPAAAATCEVACDAKAPELRHLRTGQVLADLLEERRLEAEKSSHLGSGSGLYNSSSARKTLEAAWIGHCAEGQHSMMVGSKACRAAHGNRKPIAMGLGRGNRAKKIGGL